MLSFNRMLLIGLGALFLIVPAVASAGSYSMNCAVKAELDGKKYELSTNHYAPKKDADYTAKPYDITLEVDGKKLKLKEKKKVGGLWIFDFRTLQVVYSGADSEPLERFAFFYEPSGRYIARVKCK